MVSRGHDRLSTFGVGGELDDKQWRSVFRQLVAAGLLEGDVIVGWNNEKLSSVRSLLRSLGPDSVGTVVDVMARRAGEPVTFKLTIGERPER